MSLELNDARLKILRNYYGTIHVEGEYQDEIVVRIPVSPIGAEMIYAELVATEEL